MLRNPDLSIILPCRNEEEALPECLKSIKQVVAMAGIDAEIIVSDSSVDRSPEIAREFGAVLVKHDQFGYGRACLEGFKKASGQYLFLADADATYDFKEIPVFLNNLKQGYDFVIGNRFAGKIDAGAMPWSHRYLGNPVLSFLVRLFFRSKVTDVHCGMRAITKAALMKMNLQSTGMEFASEMVIKAGKNNLKIKELPINYHQRKGQSKLNTFSDGWRHLRFLLLFSPLFLFFIPGLILFLSGLFFSFLIYFDFTILGRQFSYHPLFLTISLIIIGYQLIIFGFFAKVYAITHLGEDSLWFNKLWRYLTLEKSVLAGLFIFVLGALVYALIFNCWAVSGFEELQEVKRSLVALAFVIVGIQTVFSSFMLSILGIKDK